MPHPKTYNRRRFLRQTALATVAAPWFIPRSVLGATSVSPGPNERVSVGIIGCGQRGTQLSNDLPPGAEIVALADADLRKTDKLLAMHQAKWNVYQDYRQMFDQGDLDAVLVCAADHHHILAGVLACVAGKDVYCEKPLSLYVREGRVLVQAARRYQRVVQTGTQQRTMEMNQFACELVRDGGIGKVRAVECVNYASPINYPQEGFAEEAIPQKLAWDLWQGQAVTRPYSRNLASHWTDGFANWWGNWWDYSGHQMTGMGAHAFDMVQYALGMSETGPVEFWPVEKGPEARMRFRYANGVEVRLRFSDHPPYRGPRLGAIFVGDQCKIEINRNKFTTNPPDFVKDGPDPQVAEKWEGDGWKAKGHIQNWLDCIKSRERPHADIEIGHRTATVCHLLNITRQLGRKVHWDPEREQCPDDKQANALLDRPRRKGWELPSVPQ